MANYGFDDVKISISTATGSTLVDISQHVIEFSGVNLTAETEESHAAGDSWKEHLYSQFKSGEDMTLKVFYDDAANTTPFAIAGSPAHLGNERNFEVDFGASDVNNGDVLIKSFKKTGSRGKLTMAELVLVWTGAVGTATAFAT